MSTKISFTYGGKDYELKFTKRTIKQMEQNGFNYGDIDTKPVSVLDDLFKGSFLANHKFEKPEVMDQIFSMMKNKDQLADTLAIMYAEQVNGMYDADEQGNLDWVKNQ